MWWLAIPIGAYAAKKIYEIATEADSSSSYHDDDDDEYERAKRKDREKKIKLIKKDLVGQYSEDMRSFFAEHSDVLRGTVPNDLKFKKVNSLLNEFSANIRGENFLQFIRKIAPDADYTKDFKQLDADIQQLDTEIKQLRNLKNELLQSLEENL
jgi:hypothetical protein